MPSIFRQFIKEIKQREVIQVVVAYGVIGWLILQVAGLTFGPLGLPEGSIRLLIIITIAGFPAVFFLAWLINVNSKGIMFDLPLWHANEPNTEAEGDGEPAKDTKQKPNKTLAVMLCLLVIVGTWWLVTSLNGWIKPTVSKKVETIVEASVPVFSANSIAVLAFENFDGQQESNYFSDGLSEEILNYLASINELNVAARTSSFRFKGEQIDVREVAKLLNVKHILQGSVRREGNRVRISAQLIDGSKGFHAWSKSYDRDLDDIFAIQREIAAAVVNELKIALSVDSKSRLQQTQSENIDAYIYYLQGIEKLRNSPDKERTNTAIKLFNQALIIDSSFSRAYAGLCEANLGLYERSNNVEDFKNAELACDKAQTLNIDVSSEVQVALGRLYRFRGLYQKAEDTLLNAISNSPNEVDAYIELGEVHAAQKKHEDAESAFLRAIDLKRNYWKAHEALASFYFAIERYSESVMTYETVTRLTPDSSLGYDGMGSAYWMLGETERALNAYEQSLTLNPSRQTFTNLGMFYYYSGQFEQAVSKQMKALELAEDDHRVWGRLAESYRFVAGQENESQFAYKRAAELAQSNLDINKEDWFTRSLLALYLSHLGEQDEAIDAINAAIKQSARNPEVLYFNALIVLRENNIDKALSLLEEAVIGDNTYRLFIALDPDLRSLKDKPRFIALLP